VSSSQLATRHTTLSTDDALLLLLLLDLPPASSLPAVESLCRLPLLSSRRLALADRDDADAAISLSWRRMCADCTADAVVCVSLLTFCGIDAALSAAAATADDDDNVDVEWLVRLDDRALTDGGAVLSLLAAVCRATPAAVAVVVVAEVRLCAR